METVPCNLCNSTAATPMYQLSDLLLERSEVETTLVQCQICGLIYQNPRPTQDEMAQHYPPEYDSYISSGQNEQKISWLLQKAYQFGINKRVRIVTRHKMRGRLLDVGCATGTFLSGMQQQPNWELFGVEINEFAARIAHEQFGLNVFVGTLEEAYFPATYFDAVALWDVFEHLHDPAGSLNEIHRVLKQEGILILRVPNVNSWDAKIFGTTWAGLDAPRHFYVFGQDTLKQMLEANGFQIKQISCEIGSYPTFVLSVRFWLVEKEVREIIRQSILNILYHPISRLLFSPIYYLYGIGLRGPLITVIAVKRRDC